ncbi:hypothetical protein F5144DRAFT_586783 [Chaetomium tenue]|uniref:Uncharacterized protein n=1 Tax=Chaetomium tenue TaxID=1854479 RepID=A0ACB7NXT2_9PEZI|nr:hypothetical protein F5144DRAFT_586783 [Chaetomium globosum]
MQLFSRVGWSLVASLACLGAAVNATDGGVIEASLVFPRNETYAPTDSLPVVFAFQNAELAEHFNFHIAYTIRNASNIWGNESVNFSQSLKWANWSSHEPYFSSTLFKDKFMAEGEWQLRWEMSWGACEEDSFLTPPPRVSNLTLGGIDFTIKSGAQVVDLVAGTANDKPCTEKLGLAVNVTGQVKQDSRHNECAVVVSSSTPTPNPCRVSIGSATAASISASWTARACNATFPPDFCPPEEDSSSQRLAVAGVASLAAAFGALAFFLVA